MAAWGNPEEAALGLEQNRDPGLEPPAEETTGAVLALLFAALSFSLMTVCVKGAGVRLPLAEVVLARGLVSGGLSWWMLRRSRISPWGTRRRLLASRGLLGSLALACIYGAVTRLPLATATLLQYLYPTFTALFAWRSLGEPLSRRALLGCGCGWLGVLLVSQAIAPTSPGVAAEVGLSLAVAGALLTALTYVSVRELGRSEQPLVIVFWFPLLAVPLSLPFVLLDPVLPAAGELMWLLGVGLFAQLGQIGLTHGLIRLPAVRATTIGYAQVPFAALWGWLWFGEGIGPGTGLGALLILVAALLSR